VFLAGAKLNDSPLLRPTLETLGVQSVGDRRAWTTGGMPTRATHCHDPEFGHHFLLDKPARSMRGLTHLIDHPDPEVRALAAVDQALLEPPLEDPDDAVRRAAATNPTLTPWALENPLRRPPQLAFHGDVRTGRNAGVRRGLGGHCRAWHRARTSRRRVREPAARKHTDLRGRQVRCPGASSTAGHRPPWPLGVAGDRSRGQRTGSGKDLSPKRIRPAAARPTGVRSSVKAAWAMVGVRTWASPLRRVSRPRKAARRAAPL
jgi:hypothetical protein